MMVSFDRADIRLLVLLALWDVVGPVAAFDVLVEDKAVFAALLVAVAVGALAEALQRKHNSIHVMPSHGD